MQFLSANQIINFCGILPDIYYADEAVRAGLLSIMASAGIGLGWKGRAACVCSYADLAQLALALIAQTAIAAPSQNENPAD